MKLERMLSIITYLLSHEKVKAQVLAQKYEVSVRTIYRDIEAISAAGIPIVAYQGVEGGISLMDGYKLDKTVFTYDELLKIITGLRGLQSISDDSKTKLLIDKIQNITNHDDCISTGDEIYIDLSSWNKNDQLAGRIKDIKYAIREKRLIEFTYCSNETVTNRRVEPCIIVFKETNWYLYAYCLLRNDFRLFKLRRMTDLSVTDINYEKREFSIDFIQSIDEKDMKQADQITALFDSSLKYSVNDIFGVDNYVTSADGRLKVSFNMEESSWLYGFIMGFGDKIEIVEPQHMRERIKKLANDIYLSYGG